MGRKRLQRQILDEHAVMRPVYHFFLLYAIILAAFLRAACTKAGVRGLSGVD